MATKYEYLRPFIGKIVLAKGVASKFITKWKEEREAHIMSESDLEILEYTDHNLREILPHELIIEFDAIDKSVSLDMIKIEATRWCDKVCELFESQNKSYVRTSHQGKSDHIRIYIDDLVKMPARIIKAYKREFYNEILKIIKFKSDIVCPDMGFCVRGNKLVPLEHKPHWKLEHTGRIVQVVKEFKGDPFNVKSEIIERIESQTLENLRADNRDIMELSEFDTNAQKLCAWLENYFIDGKRNDCIMALSGYCHRIGMSEQDFTKLFESCLINIGLSAYFEDAKNTIPYTFSKKRNEVAVTQYLQHITDDIMKIRRELRECFTDKSKESFNREKLLLSLRLKADTDELGRIFGKKLRSLSNLFYRPLTEQLVEVNLIQNPEDASKNITKLQVVVVDDLRLKNLLQRHYDFFTLNKKEEEVAMEIPLQLARVLLRNTEFLASFKKLDKVMNRPYLFENENGLQKEYKGHSEFTCNYYTPDTPELTEVSPDIARSELLKILDGFCFETDSDREMAIAYILTPALRGLYSNKRKRTPCFAMIANRERAGKDYLAGVRSMIYNGAVIDNPPISDGERSNVDEWRKKFASILLKGETLFHSANNVGYMNNPVFEMLITSEYFEDRMLGSNTQRQIDNYLDISFSANVGLRWRGDMSGRMRRVYLFYEEEDPNSREFPIPDLHEYISRNRGYIISCIYSLIESWYKAGKPCQEGKVFTSFREWAVICGAIMDYHKLGDPLIYQEDDELSGNQDESIMRSLFLFMLRWQQNNNKWDLGISDIISAVANFQSNYQEGNSLGYEDVNAEDLMVIAVGTGVDKNKFGRMCKKYRGRILNGIKYAVVSKNKESKRWRYTFQPMEKKQ